MLTFGLTCPPAWWALTWRNKIATVGTGLKLLRPVSDELEGPPLWR
jgi:hypothetical protein